MAEIAKVYHVLMESKQTLSQEAETITVSYSAPTYNEAWTGARSVCRLGTNFGAEKGGINRHFFKLDEDGGTTDEPFEVQPSVWTVRRIFVQNTRKQGKRRMTVVNSETFKAVLGDKKIKMSSALETLLTEVLNESGGVKITVATARRLGIKTPETEVGDEEAGAA